MKTTSVTTTPRIFISHSHEDDVVGLRLASDLRAALGEDAVWYDASGSLHVGDAWWEKIVEELTVRNVFIVILSPAALQSEWVQKEMALALEQSQRTGKHLLPLAYRPCSLPDEWKRIHALTMSDPTTQPEAYAAQLATLFDALVDIQYPALASEPAAPVEPEHKRTPLRTLVGGARMLLCWVTLIVYWLLIGYLTPSLFPERLLRISGSDALVATLRGNSGAMQLPKALIILFSLILDWLWIGALLSRIPGLNLFSLSYSLIAIVFGAFSIGVFFYLYGRLQHMQEIGWKYTNVINIRKVMEVTLVAGLLGLATLIQFFSGAFLYFPVLVNVVSLCLFFYTMISLGGTPYGRGFSQYNAARQRLLWNQLVNDRRSRVYAERARLRQRGR